jgi:hypothetical protein
MSEQYVEIYAIEGRHIAELVKQYFEAAGIPLEISQESAGSTIGLTVAPMGVAHLLVPESRLDEAEVLLEEYLARSKQDG